MIANIETIGPAEAQALLALNTRNRHVSRKIVSSLARDMIDGRWSLNGESIKVSASGKLIDGQHRLLAVVESGATVTTLIVRGLDDDAQDTVDIGARRMFSDILQIEGEINAHNLAAAVRTGWHLDNFNKIRERHVVATTQELHQWLDDNHQIREWINTGRMVAMSPVRYVPSLATALSYMMGKINLTQSEEFWTALAHGGERPGSPVHALREALLRDVGSPRRMTVDDRGAITIKMWNYWRDGRDDVKVAVYRSSGPGAEQFPVIK